MPLYRRLPKRGFTNIFRKEYEVINLDQLIKLKNEGPVTPVILKSKGMIHKIDLVKILGNGELTEAVTIHAHKFSKSAKDKIEKSGGKAITI